jgi:autotransporter-associated beta strand protein
MEAPAFLPPPTDRGRKALGYASTHSFEFVGKTRTPALPSSTGRLLIFPCETTEARRTSPMLRNPCVGLRRSLRYAGRGGLVLGAVAVCAIGVKAATTGWQQTAGSFTYNDPANWVGGNINNLFHSSLTLTGPLQITIPQTYTTTGNLAFIYAQGQAGNDITMDGAGATPAILTLGGNLTYNPTPAPGGSVPKLTLGGNLTVDLVNAARTIDVHAGAQVRALSVFQGGGNLTVTGGGPVYLSGASTYTGPTQIAGFVDLGADALPNVPGPFGNASSAVQLNLAALPGAGNVVTLNLQPGVTMGRALVVAGGTLTSSGGATYATGTITMQGNLNINVGAGGTMYFSDGGFRQGGASPGQYLITFNGAGTAVLGNTASLQTGPILVKSGKLLCNGTLTFFLGGAINVEAGELGGVGNIPNKLTVGDGSGMADALLSPGDGIGTLHTAAVTLGSDAEFKFELNSTAGTYDLLSANGAVQLGSAILSLSDLGATALPVGFQFALIENTSSSATTGTFQGLSDGATFQVGANTVTVDYDATLDGDGVANDVVLKVIPEPAGGALLAVGALLAGLTRRRRRRGE